MWCDNTEAIQTQVPYSKGHAVHSTQPNPFDNVVITYTETKVKPPHSLLLTSHVKPCPWDPGSCRKNIWSFCSNLMKTRLSISSPQTLEGTSNCKGTPWEDPVPKAFGRAAAAGCEQPPSLPASKHSLKRLQKYSYMLSHHFLHQNVLLRAECNF